MHTHFPLPVLVIGAGSLLMFALGFLLTANGQARRRFFALPPLLQKAYVVVFMAPIAAMPLVPQARYQSAPLASAVAGALLLACAVCLWASALRAMRGVPGMREAKGLVTTGAYGLVRNPLYTANALVLPGFGLLTQSLAALFFAPVVVGLFLVQSILEEGGLRAEYGAEYAAYRERVRHRLLPFVL